MWYPYAGGGEVGGQGFEAAGAGRDACTIQHTHRHHRHMIVAVSHKVTIWSFFKNATDYPAYFFLMVLQQGRTTRIGQGGKKYTVLRSTAVFTLAVFYIVALNLQQIDK